MSTDVDGKCFWGNFEMDMIIGRGNHDAIVILIECVTFNVQP